MSAPNEKLRCLTPYDFRGRVPETFGPDIAARIALAFARRLDCRRVVLGRDIRLSSPDIAEALRRALIADGRDVIDLGLRGTEEMYCAVFSGEDAGIDGGIMVTASHNPADYNGMKLVGRGARPIAGAELEAVAELAARAGDPPPPRPPLPRGEGSGVRADRDAYIRRLLAIAPPDGMKPLRVVVNSGNGCAGPVVDALAPHLPLELVRLRHEPDGRFPNGVPNPLLPERRADTAEAVIRHKADMGVAWDGDFDRCFFFDEKGRFIEGYYIVGLLAEAMLRLHPNATILHDPRLVWNTREIVEKAGGRAVMVRAGHSFIKEAMRREDAVYGGEMSAHHYFRDFGRCDSGMLPWLLVCRLLAEKDRPLSALVDAAMRAYPVSGEINTRLQVPPERALAAVRARHADGRVDETDGLSVEYPDFRFNLRPSGTEPLLRLNVESRGDAALVRARTEELLTLIRTFA